MADDPQPSSPEPHDNAAPPAMPRWVKTLLLVLLAVVIVVVLVMAISGGEHGPGRHGSLGARPGQALVAAPAPADPS